MPQIPSLQMPGPDAPVAIDKSVPTPSGHEMGGDMADMNMTSASDSVMVSARKQQMIGVKTTKAQVLSLTRNMRTVGQVEVDERLLEHVHIKLEGW
ncbi:MAG: hypothetical protein R3351_05035, partial [Nitrospirales bacterium]|nr:hypothetical protein [Nitrospirales bacterium]